MAELEAIMHGTTDFAIAEPAFVLDSGRTIADLVGQIQFLDHSVPVHPLETLLRDMFDSTHYVWLYGDLAEAATSPTFSPFQHFIDYGMKEGRSPSLYFDSSYAGARLSELTQCEVPAGVAFTAFAELAVSHRFIPNAWFRPWALRARYGKSHDQLYGLSDWEVFVYYMKHCRDAALSPSGLFNEEAYRAAHQDVAGAVACCDVSSGFIHFITGGGQESRANLPGYGASVERKTTLPVEADFLLAGGADIGPVLWYFDEEFYLSVYKDAHALKRDHAIGSGLEHFITIGFAEGRIPHPAAAASVTISKSKTGWAFLAFMASRPPPASRQVDMAAACAIRDRLCEGGADRRAVTDALWRFTAAPAIRARVDPARYFAVNPDIAETLNHNADAAQTHWETYGFKEQRAAPGTNFFENRGLKLKGILDWKNGVNFFAPVSSTSGLGNAARGYLAALRAAEIPVEVHDISAMLNLTMPADMFNADDLAYGINFFFLNADQVLPFAARYGTECFDGRANVAAWVWELAAPRPEWRAALAAFDLIVVPSEFTAASFRLFTETEVQVIPYVVDAIMLRRAAATGTPDHWCERLSREKTAGRKIVLFVMDASSYTARKGLDIYEKLADQVNAAHPGKFLFVLKTHSRDYSRADAARISDKRFLVIDGIMDFNDLCRLKAFADVYVSPHRSEGFGLNIFESIMLGVPALCTDFGGPVGLLGPDYPYLVSGGLTEIGRDMGPYRAEAVWFEPDLAVLSEKLLALDSASVAALATRLEAALSATAIGARFRDVLGRFCGYAHPGGPQDLDRFIPLMNSSKDECFDFAVPAPSGVPDLGQLHAIVTGSGRPFFSVITVTRNTPAARLLALYAEMIGQSHAHWEWCIVDDASDQAETVETLARLRKSDARIQVHFSASVLGLAAGINTAARFASGAYLMLHDTECAGTAGMLAAYRTWIDGDAAGGVFYCDGLDDPHAVPGWSYDQLLAGRYPRHAICMRKAIFLKLGGYDPDFGAAAAHEFLLRAAAAGTPFRHVRDTLYACLTTAAPEPDLPAGLRAVAAHLKQSGLDGRVEAGGETGLIRVRPSLPPEPVSISILATGHADSQTALERLVGAILDHKPAQAFNLRIITGPGSLARSAQFGRRGRQVKVVTHKGINGGLSTAEAANFAVRSAVTARVVLLGEDLIATNAHWLEALLEMLEVPGVGIAGGQIAAPDGKVLQAGITLGGPSLVADAAWPADCVTNYAAVGFACMAFRRATFDLAGGFDETLPTALSDADFCLKAGDAGLRVVHTPYARLVKSGMPPARRLPPDSLEARRFARKWSAVIAQDRFGKNATATGTVPDESVRIAS